MTITAPLALLALAALQQQTDTTVSVSATARLNVRTQAGEIVVRSWDRYEVRVQAEHGSRDFVEISTRVSVVTVRARRRRGMPAIVDYTLTVPRSMSLSLGGIHAEIDISGVRGDITAESIEGDIRVRDGGSMSLSSVEGDITVAGAQGDVRVHAIDGELTLTNITGDVIAETIDGSVTLEGIDGTNVDISTVDGDLLYRGTVKDNGRYRMTSHDGDVVLIIPESANATVSVATYDGEFEAHPAFRITLERTRPGRRFSFVLGNGSAQIELESFDGSIELRRR